MIQRSSCLMLLAGLLLLTNATAQNNHDRPGFPQLVNAGRVSYEIKASIDSKNARLQGGMEIDYRNLSNDTLREIVMSFPPAVVSDKTTAQIDSLLINGQPVPSLRSAHAEILNVPLFDQLLPGGRVHLYLSFASPIDKFTSRRGSHPVLSLVDWYPSICSRSNGKWISTDSSGQIRSLAEAADYAISISVDTGWMAAAFGTLINEKEVYGIIPRKGDTTITTLPHDSDGDPFAPSAYPHPEGRIIYAWRALQRPSFPIALFKGAAFDRVIVDSAVIDLFSLGEKGDDLWESSLASVSTSVRKLATLLDGSPLPQMAFVAGVGMNSGEKDRSPLLSESPESGTTSWMAAQMTALARLWTMPILSDSSAQTSPVQSGITYYLAIEIANELSPKHGYDLCAQYADQQLGLNRFNRFPSSGRPFSWMDRLRRSQYDSDRPDSLFSQLYTIPAKLHFLRQMVGDSAFWDRFANSVRLEDGGYLTEAQFWSLMTGGSGTIDYYFAGDEITNVDFSLFGVSQKEEGSEVVISGFCESGLPFQVTTRIAALMSSSDTVWQEIEIPAIFSSSRYPFRIHVKGIPRAIIVDPFGLLPDGDRANNVFNFSTPTFTPQSPRNLFPGYRRLKLPQ